MPQYDNPKGHFAFHLHSIQEKDSSAQQGSHVHLFLLLNRQKYLFCIVNMTLRMIAFELSWDCRDRLQRQIARRLDSTEFALVRWGPRFSGVSSMSASIEQLHFVRSHSCANTRRPRFEINHRNLCYGIALEWTQRSLCSNFDIGWLILPMINLLLTRSLLSFVFHPSSFIFPAKISPLWQHLQENQRNAFWSMHQQLSRLWKEFWSVMVFPKIMQP